MRERWERNPAQGAPFGWDEPNGARRIQAQFVPVVGALPMVAAGEQDPAVVDVPFLMATMFLMVSEDSELLF